MADQPADFIFTEYHRGPIIMALFIRSFLYYPIYFYSQLLNCCLHTEIFNFDVQFVKYN